MINLKLLFLMTPLLLWTQGTKYNRIAISEDISMKIPEEFTPVPDGQMINRHVHFRRPMALFSDPNNDVDLSINQNPTRWRASDIAILKDFQKSNILNLYDEVEFSKEEIQEIRGRQFAVFEFVSSVKGDQNSIRNNSSLKKYTYVQYTVYKGQTLVANFTSSLQTKRRWAPVAAEVMNSIALK